MTTKDDYQCTNVETPNCYMEEKVINDVTCTNSVEFNCKRDKSTKNDGYGHKEVVCTRTPKQDCYNIPRKIQVEVCKTDVHRYCEKFSNIFPFPVEKQNCHFEPKKICELEMKTRPKKAKKHSYTKDCKEQPREICDQCEKKSIQPLCDMQERLTCTYKPREQCQDETKQYCYKEEDEENGNDVMTILEKVTDDEEEKNEEHNQNKILEKVERSDSVDTETSLNKPEENRKESLEKEKIVNITKKVKGRRQSGSSVGSQGSQDSSYLFSNTRVFPRTFPQHLKTKIDRDNLEFDEEQEARHHARMAEIHDQQNKRRTMILQYKGLRWDSEDEDGKMGTLDPDNQDSEEEEDSDDESWEFLPLDWLMSYLETPATAGVIETRHLLCLHSKLDIDKLTEVKLVDSNMATQLYSDNGEGAGPRLNHEHLCRYCVNNKARLLSLECRMSRDNQFLAQERSPQDGTGFWVGKKSFLRWRHLARTDLEDQIVEEVQHWKWQEETRMQAFREEQQRRILEMQKAKLQSIRGRVGAGAGLR